jgi:hypothetical protein
VETTEDFVGDFKFARLWSIISLDTKNSLTIWRLTATLTVVPHR